MYDLKVVVVDVLGFCDQPMQVGDYFEVRGGRLYIPADRYFCLWAMNSVLPMLPAKQRRSAESNDWLKHTSRISCPDPAGRVIMQIEHLDEGSGSEITTDAQPILKGMSSQVSSPAEPPARLLIQSHLCTGCGRCVQVCSNHHDDSVSRIIPSSQEGFGVCRQCGNARCVQACPSGALQRDPETHAVLIDAKKCTGCLQCGQACPFDAVISRENGPPAICHLCEGNPRCVEVCPSGAILYTHGVAEQRRQTGR